MPTIQPSQISQSSITEPDFPGVIVIRNAFTPVSCRNAITWAERSGFREASIRTQSGAKRLTGVRNNDRTRIEAASTAQTALNHLWPWAQNAIPNVTIVGANPMVRFYRYIEGQRFLAHRDGAHRIDNTVTAVTCLVYLNDDFAGGTTDFFPNGPREARTDGSTWSLKAGPGDAVVFWHNIWHAGAPVTSGTKYVLRIDFLTEAEVAD